MTCLIICISVIVTDKANILLRYLHQQWEVKVLISKSANGNQTPPPSLGFSSHLAKDAWTAVISPGP